MEVSSTYLSQTDLGFEAVAMALNFRAQVDYYWRNWGV